MILDFTLEGTSPHVVAGVLKMFFRELPEPLIPFKMYEPLVNAFRANQFSEIFRLVDSFDHTARNVLVYLMKFLGTIAHYEVRCS